MGAVVVATKSASTLLTSTTVKPTLEIRDIVGTTIRLMTPLPSPHALSERRAARFVLDALILKMVGEWTWRLCVQQGLVIPLIVAKPTRPDVGLAKNVCPAMNIAFFLKTVANRVAIRRG